MVMHKLKLQSLPFSFGVGVGVGVGVGDGAATVKEASTVVGLVVVTPAG
jgi:hypothetical protein